MGAFAELQFQGYPNLSISLAQRGLLLMGRGRIKPIRSNAINWLLPRPYIMKLAIRNWKLIKNQTIRAIIHLLSFPDEQSVKHR
jgi:hypothetical protein